MRYIYLSCFWLVFSCTGQIELQPINQSNATEVLPEFNFRVRVVNGSDIIKSTESQNYLVYIKQLEYVISKQIYYITFQPTNGYDGNIEYDKKLYLPNDLIPIDYDSMKNNEVLLKYYPIKPAIGTYQIQFTCFDKNKKSRSFIRNITVNP